jgi:hypothetical protein
LGVDTELFVHIGAIAQEIHDHTAHEAALALPSDRREGCTMAL